MPIIINPLFTNPNILDQQEQQLVPSQEMVRYFGLPNDYIQLYIYDNVGNIISSNLNFQNYSVTENKEISYDPQVDITEAGIRLGTYNMVYNFQRPVLTLNPNLDLFIKTISPDRTEVKVATTTDNSLFYSNIITYINTIQSRNYFLEFYLDLGQNKLIPAVSLAAEQDPITGNSYAIIKLLDPLPTDVVVNSPLNVVEKIVDTQEYEAVLTTDIVTTGSTVPSLREANFSLNVDSLRIGSSDYYNYNQIINETGSNSQFQELLGFISSSNPTVNVDYLDYNNFVHFGSAVQQLETFKTQLQKIQTYQAQVAPLPKTDPNYIILNSRINEILQQFTGYQNFLYYQSGSACWPKFPGDKPYTNKPVSDVESITWYATQLASASYFDEFNNNNLVYGLPQYIQESPSFENLRPFVYSMGEMFDDIWIYIKAMTDLWRAENSLYEGISKDIVGDALQSLGVKLYTDGDQDNIYEYLYGVNSSGSYTFVTQSYQTGITASQYTMSGQDEAKSVFKRIYANLPTLLKSKGTDRFVNYLNTIYGTPDTILFPMEFGGVDKNLDSVEYAFNRFTYAIQSKSNEYYYVRKNPTNPDNNQCQAFEFRFKPSNPTLSTLPQPLLTATDHNTPSQPFWGISVEPVTYQGYPYGRVIFYIQESFNTSYQTLVTDPLPLYVTSSNEELDWWNVRIQKVANNTYNLKVQNEVQGEIGHKSEKQSLLSVPVIDLDSTPNRFYELGNIDLSYGTTINPAYVGSGTYYGLIQEFRGWLTTISNYNFDTHTLNPEAYIGSTTSSAYDNLLFKFPLGNDLMLMEIQTTGSQPNQSYNRVVEFVNFPSSSYTPFTEMYYTRPAIGGYSTPVTEKVRIGTQITASNQLRPEKSIVYNPTTSSRTTDIHLTQVGFSPQDQINNDIIAQLGTTYDLDNLLGNPQFSNLDYYPGISQLQEQYFKKYDGPYNYKDFIQLMETFHKSLFRYLEDYVPGRSNNATGVVIKPHILERSKTRRYEPTINTASYDGEIQTVTIEGSNPGGYCCSRNSPLNEAFFDGEFEGSVIPMDSYFDQNNPFTTAMCDCRQYQVVSDGLIIWTGCNGEAGVDNQPGLRTIQVFACKNKVGSLFGSVSYVQELGKFAKGQAFVEQYEGWDALNNNVVPNVQSRYKFKTLPVSKSIDTNAYNCLRWKVTRNPVTSINQPMFVYYKDCNGSLTCLNLNATGPSFSNTVETFIVAREDGPPQWSDPGLAIAPCFNITNTPRSFFTSSFEGYVTLRDKRVFNYFSQSVEWQDTNLSDAGYIFSREAGTLTTTPIFNKTFPADFTFNVYNNTFLGSNSLPNVEQTVDYMLYYDWVTSSLADKVGTSNFHIRYLINSSGSVSKPTFSSSYYWDTEQAFEAYTPINITLYNNNNQNLQTSKLTTTFRPVRNWGTILYSDTGSRGKPALQTGYFNRINFTIPNQETIPNFEGKVSMLYPTNLKNLQEDEVPYVIRFDTVENDPLGAWVPYAFKVPASVTNQVDVNCQILVDRNVGLFPGNNLVKVAIWKNAPSLKLNEVVYDFTSGDELHTFNVSYSGLDVTANDVISATIELEDASENITILTQTSPYVQSYLEVTPAVTPGSDPWVDNPYWEILPDALVETSDFFGSPIFESKKNILLGNVNFNRFYQKGYFQDPNIAGTTSGSGFSIPLEFNIQPGDQIRFGGEEVQTYTVVTASLSFYDDGSMLGERVWIELDRFPVVNANYFVVRRLVPDPGFVIVNGTQYEGPGFIIPQYPSPQLKNNLSNIIADLSARNLIP